MAWNGPAWSSSTLPEGAVLKPLSQSCADVETAPIQAPFPIERPKHSAGRALNLDERPGARVKDADVDDNPWAPLIVDNRLDMLRSVHRALQHPSASRRSTAALVWGRLMARRAVWVPKTTFPRGR